MEHVSHGTCKQATQKIYKPRRQDAKGSMFRLIVDCKPLLSKCNEGNLHKNMERLQPKEIVARAPEFKWNSFWFLKIKLKIKSANYENES